MNHEAAAPSLGWVISGLLRLMMLSVLIWMWWQLQATPVRLFPDEIRITLEKGGSRMLGR